MSEQEEGKIDIDKELEEFIKNKLISSYEVLSKTETSWDVKLITLENYKILITFDVSNGIIVRSPERKFLIVML